MANTSLHGGAGAWIAGLYPSWYGLVYAFVFHFVLDLFPESYLPPKKWYIIGESILIGVAIGLIFIIGVNPWWMFWGFVFGNLPDLIDTLMFKFTGKRLFFCHPKPRWTSLGFEFQTWGLPQWINLIIDVVVVIWLLI